MGDARDDYEGQDNGPMPPLRPETELREARAATDPDNYYREDALYRWQGIVWRPGRVVPVYSAMEPPEFVLAFRSGAYLLERQAPAADGSSLWTWVDVNGLAVGDRNRPWHDALEGTTELTVARVKNSDGSTLSATMTDHVQSNARPDGSNLRAAPRLIKDVVRPEPLPFTPFPRPVARPAEPEEGTVIGFAKQFQEDGPTYSFAAIHAVKGQWFLSGPRHGGRAMTWDALLDFIGGPLDWARVGVVGSWDHLGDL